MNSIDMGYEFCSTQFSCLLLLTIVALEGHSVAEMLPQFTGIDSETGLRGSSIWRVPLSP